MTELFQQAIAKIAKLSDEQQNAIEANKAYLYSELIRTIQVFNSNK